MINNLSQNIHGALPSAPSSPYELNPCKGFFSIVTAAGQIIRLNDLGVKVLSYMGGGMPPVENITTPLGILGGSILQRSVARPRTITLACAIYGRDLLRVQRIKQSLISLLAPSVSQQTAASIKLRFQLVDNRGNLLGNILEVPVIYAGDLTGITDNLYEERFALQFLELAPPGIVELTLNTISMALATNVASVPGGYQYRQVNGIWVSAVVNKVISGLGYHPTTNDLWIGTQEVSPARIYTRSGSVTQNLTGPATPYADAIAFDAAGGVYIGGDFTSPHSYIMYYNGATFVAAGTPAAFNAAVLDLALDYLGNVYAVGNFTTPGNFISRYNGAAWSALGTGLSAQGRAVVTGLNGLVYVGGNFLTANAVSVNYIAAYNGTTFLSLAGGLNGLVRCLAVLPDGRIIAGGDFTASTSGVTLNKIGIWNGTQWQPLGNGIGLNDAVEKILVNKVTGDITVLGVFSATFDGSVKLTNGIAKYNGTTFVPSDIIINNAPTARAIAGAIRADGELAIGESNLISIDIAGSTALNYGGTADVLPVIKITGPGQLFSIINYTTGKALYFNNLNLQASEVLTFTNQGGISFVSSFSGNILNKILQGSDTATFGLAPGVNNINCELINKLAATKIEFIYKNTHWSFEAGV